MCIYLRRFPLVYLYSLIKSRLHISDEIYSVIQKHMEQTKSSTVPVVLSIIITAVVVGGLVYWWQTNQESKLPTDQNVTEQTKPAKVTTKTYSSSEFNYSFQYPEDWFLTKSPKLDKAQPEAVWISKKEITNAEQNTELMITINRSFAGQSATKINFTGDFGSPVVSILIPQNDYTFLISYDPADQNYTNIETILNSFSFQNQNTNQQVTQPQDIVYTNSTYGFTLTFPQTWKDYTTKSRTIDWGTLGTNDSIDFGFSVQDSLFNISVHSKSQWQKLESEEGPTPTYLGENSKYVFGYAIAQDAVNNTMVARMAEIQEIIKTFGLTK